MRSVKTLFKNTMNIFKKMNTLTRICLVLALITIIFVLCKSLPTIEGFEDGKETMQSEKYKIVKNNDIYDDFYVDVYDQLVYSLIFLRLHFVAFQYLYQQIQQFLRY